MKIQTLTITTLENLKVRVKATRRGSIFIDHTLRSHEGQFMTVVEMTIISSMVSSRDGAGLVSRLNVEGDNFESNHWVLGNNNLTIVDLFETEGEVAGLSGGEHVPLKNRILLRLLTCKMPNFPATFFLRDENDALDFIFGPRRRTIECFEKCVHGVFSHNSISCQYLFQLWV
jgi:hypothetical protein